MQFLQFFFWIKFELLTSFPSFSWNGLMSGNISFITWQKMYSVPKGTEFNSKDLFNNSTLRMFYIRTYFIQYRSTPKPLWDFQSVYGPRIRNGAVWQSELVHLDETVRTHIIQSFTHRGIHYFTEQSDGTVCSGTVWKWTNFSHIIGSLLPYYFVAWKLYSSFTKLIAPRGMFYNFL